MDLHYVATVLSTRSLLFYWSKGIAFELDMCRANQELQTFRAEIGRDIVIMTMATRTKQMLVSLGKQVMSQMHWKWPSVDWMGRAARAVMWICRSVLGSLVGIGGPVTMRYYWKDLMESPAQNPTAQEKKVSPTSMPMPIQDIVTLDWNCDGQGSMEMMPHKEAIVSSCTNPIILSMVYLPSDDEDASSTSEASDLNELEEEYEQLWEDEEESFSTENNKAIDSGMQVPQTPSSKANTEESDWSDEDSWDSDSDTESSKLDEDLWASFCQNDDPYNPLCFAMPTKSPKNTQETKKAVTGMKDSATGGSVTYSVLLGESGAEAKKDFQNQTAGQRESPCIKQTSHSQVLHEEANEELLESSKKTEKQEKSHIKHVRFSPSVTVHHIVVWSYAHRMARRGIWEEYARDRCRFQRRIAETEAAIGFCMEPPHRKKIWARLHESNNE
ncbi:hypothetical protein XENTR_v10019359 [Xenopus tropicalis]|nr:protein phosphatase 1 regulatory subunit 15A isoform X2 [Xenopus tropicalis]XP_017951005.1 protein phosphatase 1 regulatory subunit 15A isoform X1 [Xenopus tropicalis]KAE8593879.1 hypothetical protein XENTR_v10019359 [Xenopus tropicalis]KAE8593880.1 hypothetical protein XENTR_v10019359 [Xenopus tropicalis]KAE8593881.1 hypothetical protein XENTR_v10019359 [Xenopus tropicalis]|eukprot:XP_017951005.1 PREDICTED: protein phosphatase 1 regulatory subunit 15A-like isoform X1 [Xenopus tropicalis]